MNQVTYFFLGLTLFMLIWVTFWITKQGGCNES